MTMCFESDYNKNIREQRVNNVVKDYSKRYRPKVGGVSANDLMNDSVPSFREIIGDYDDNKGKNEVFK